MSRFRRSVALVTSLVFAALPSSGAPLPYVAKLTAVLANGSPATGTVFVTWDDVQHQMTIDASFADLLALDTSAHVHCCAVPGPNAGVAVQTPSLTGFPLSVTSGTYSHTFDTSLASTYSPAFVTAQGGVALAEKALGDGLAAGTAYFDIHTTIYPGGEIRGWLTRSFFRNGFENGLTGAGGWSSGFPVVP